MLNAVERPRNGRTETGSKQRTLSVVRTDTRNGVEGESEQSKNPDTSAAGG